jgi:hypothetical protein
MQCPIRTWVAAVLALVFASTARADVWMMPYLGTGDASHTAGEVGSTLFAGDQFARWAATRNVIQGVDFHEFSTRTMTLDELFQLVDAGERVELTADEAAVYPIACSPDETPAAAHARDRAKWVARAPDGSEQSLVGRSSGGRTFRPTSIMIGEILNVKRGQCAQQIEEIRQFYLDYLRLLRRDFPTTPFVLSLKVPAAPPGLDLAGLMPSLIGFLCQPGRRPDVCPQAVIVEPHLFAPYQRVQDQLVRVRRYVLDPARHYGRPIEFDAFLVDECADDPSGGGNHIRQRLVLDPSGPAHCSSGPARSNWLPNVMSMDALYTHVFGTPDYASRIEISDWTDTFHDPRRIDSTTRANPLVLGASDGATDTFVGGARVAAEALEPGSINRYVGASEHFTGVEVPGYRFGFQTQLGYVRGPGASAVELYACWDGNGQFLSDDSHCEGAHTQDVEGWLRSPTQPQPPDARPLYECEVPRTGDRFVSNAANCEGQKPEGLLGYACDRPGSC